MIDYQQLVDDIQNLLYSAAPVDPDRISRLAMDYYEASEEANTRLRQCGQLLNQGLRSEALQQCEIEPNILDVVARLDFPELSQWLEVLAHYSLVGPPALMLHVAADLNAAYGEEQPLSGLLKRHRMLAIARAPLFARLLTLRQIAERDANPIWRADIAEYEKARVDELRREGKEAFTARDFSTLERVYQETSSDSWQEPPPREAISPIVADYHNLRQQMARDALKFVERELNEAFAAYDVDAGRRARARWEKCVDLANLDDDNELLLLADPALQWLNQQDAEEESNRTHGLLVQEFEKALEGDDPHEKRKAYVKLARHELGVPDELKSRLKRQIEEAKHRKRKIRRRWIAGAATVAALLVIGIVWWVGKSRENRQIDLEIGEISQLVEQEKFVEADRKLRALLDNHSRASGRAEVEQMQTRLSAARKKENLRQQVFELSVEQARKSIPERLDSAALAQARSLAKTDAELETVTILEASFVAARKEAQARIDEAFQEQVDQLDNTVANFGDRRFADSKELDEALHELEQEIQQLGNVETTASNSYFGSTRRIRDDLKQAHAIQRDRINIRIHEQRINDSINSPSQFAMAVKSFVKEFPGNHRISASVIDEEPLWRAMQEWNQIARQWNTLDRTSISPRIAEYLIDEITRKMSNTADVPTKADMMAVLPHLQAIAKRNENDPKRQDIVSELRNALSSATAGYLGQWIVQTNDGRQFILANTPTDRRPLNQSAGPHDIAYMKDFAGTRAMTKLSSTDIDIGPVPAPHSELVEKLVEQLNGLKPNDWEAEFISMLESVHGQSNLNPTLKLRFLKQLTEAACRGSYPLAQGLAKDLRYLGSLRLNTSLNWLDPERKEVQDDRSSSAIHLRALTKDFQGVKTAVQAASRQFLEHRAREYQCVGWLSRDEESKWEVVAKQPPQKVTADLLIVGFTGKSVILEKIGTLEDGIPKLDAKSRYLVAGRLVYMVHDDN